MRPLPILLALGLSLAACTGQLSHAAAAPSSSAAFSPVTMDQLTTDLHASSTMEVEVSSYLLPRSLAYAIGEVCRRGGSSAIVLANPSYDSEIAEENQRTVEQLKHSGCVAETIDRPLHLKTIVINAKVAYISDTNFSSHGFLLRVTDGGAVALLRQTIAGNPGKGDAFATDKGDALQLEDGLIQEASGALCVSSESFGESPVAYDLYHYDGQVHLVVARREAEHSYSEQRLLRSLRDTGHVAIRLSDADEKLAIGDSVAWLGSANSTAGYPEQTDWGLLTNDPALVRFARERCEHDFDQGDALY